MHFQKLTFSFLYDIQGSKSFPEQLHVCVGEFVDMVMNGEASWLEKFAYKLFLMPSILHIPAIFSYFALSDTFLQQLFPFLTISLTYVCHFVLS
jgi:hypothetical protein